MEALPAITHTVVKMIAVFGTFSSIRLFSKKFVTLLADTHSVFLFILNS